MAVTFHLRLRRALGRRVDVPFGAAAAFLALDLALVVGYILATRQNADLRVMLSRAVAAITPGSGSLAPPLIGEDQYGRQEILQFHQDQRPTVVFTFSEDCLYCGAYWKAIGKLQPRAPHELRIEYIDTEERPKPSYLAAHGVAGAPVLTTLTPQAALAYRALALPQIEVLDGIGRVQWSYAGEITPGEVKGFLAMVAKFIYNK